MQKHLPHLLNFYSRIIRFTRPPIFFPEKAGQNSWTSLNLQAQSIKLVSPVFYLQERSEREIRHHISSPSTFSCRQRPPGNILILLFSWVAWFRREGLAWTRVWYDSRRSIIKDYGKNGVYITATAKERGSMQPGLGWNLWLRLQVLTRLMCWKWRKEILYVKPIVIYW